MFSMLGVTAESQSAICRVLSVTKSLFKKLVDLFISIVCVYYIGVIYN